MIADMKNKTLGRSVVEVGPKGKSDPLPMYYTTSYDDFSIHPKSRTR